MGQDQMDAPYWRAQTAGSQQMQCSLNRVTLQSAAAGDKQPGSNLGAREGLRECTRECLKAQQSKASRMGKGRHVRQKALCQGTLMGGARSLQCVG